MKISLNSCVLLIVSCSLTSCTFNNKKLGYEVEENVLDYQHNDVEESDTVNVDDFIECDTVVAAEEDTVVGENQQKVDYKLLPKVYSDSKFSIRYPSTWKIVQQNTRAISNSTIAVQIMQTAKNDYDFRPNVNIIVSTEKHVESTDFLARLSYIQAQHAGFATSLLGIRECTINGKRGSVAEYIANVEGYKLHVLQYIIKKKDNSTFTITMTLDHNNLSSQEALARQIIDSIKIY